MAVQRTKSIEIDPMFHVPPGVVDVRQEDKQNGEYNYQIGDIASPPTIGSATGPSSVVPMPPTSFNVVDQAVRTTPDGRTVVDVTLEFADIPGVYNIDVKMSPA